MAFINQGRHVGSGVLAGTQLMLSFNFQLQGQIPDPDATPVVDQIPYRGQPGTSVVLETTLTSLPNFQIGETVTGSANSFTATVSALGTSGTSELASCVGGGAGGPIAQTGYGGGSGGGGGSNNWGSTGTSLNVAGQGNRGGAGGDRNAFSGAGGGGGGAGAAGNGGGGNSGGTGGAGLANFYRDGNTGGTTIGTHIFAGGGGSAGGNQAPSITAGGSGGGGTGVSGTVNSGGGGGTGNAVSNGGSGIIVVRYDTSQSGFSLSGGTTATYTTGAVNYQSHTFLSTGNLTITGTGNIDALIISGGGGAGWHGNANVEGGWFAGGGGAGGMLVTTNTAMASGIYAVAIGAGGTGSSGNNATRTGNLSWITPRRVLTITGETGTFVAGEILTGGTTGATGDIISV